MSAPAFAIREAQEGELEACAQVIRDSFSTVAKEFGFTKENAPTHRAFLTVDRLRDDRQKGNRQYVLCVGEAIAGFVELAGQEGGVFSMEELAVLPEYRHTGYGRALMDRVRSEAALLGASRLDISIIEENERLKSWYIRYGFAHDGTRNFPHLPFTVGFLHLDIPKRNAAAITTILFDLDGTLLDTLEDLLDSVNFALRAYGLPQRSIEQVKAGVGNGCARLLALFIPDGQENPRFDELVATFANHYERNNVNKTRPYSGIDGMLRQLHQRGIKMGIVSNKGDAAVAILRERFFAETIKVAVGERQGVRRKPAPDAVYAAMEALGSKKEECLYVGDSDVDIQTARNAGIPCLCVSWGFRPRESLLEAGAAAIADSVEEALAYMCSLSVDPAIPFSSR